MDKNRGIIFGLIAVLGWCFCNVFYRFCTVEYDVHPLLFAPSAMLAGSLAMLVYAGPGALTKDTIIDPRTWVYGLMQIVSSIFLMYLFTLTTSTEGALLSRFSVIIAFVLSFMFLSRKPKMIDLFSIAVVLLSISIILNGLGDDILKAAILLMFFAALAQAIRSFMAELHKANNSAKGVKDEIRVTAVVLLLTSMGFLIFNFIIASVKAYAPEFTTALTVMPSYSDFMRKETMYLSAIVGVFVVGGMKYAEFVSIKIIKSEKFLLIATVVPVITYMFENIVAQFTNMSVSEIGRNDILAGSLLIFGSAIVAFYKLRQKDIDDKISQSNKYTNALERTQISIKKTLEYCNGDPSAASEKLGIKEATLLGILESKKEYSVQTLQKVRDAYSDKIDGHDARTGLQTRTMLKIEAERAKDKDVKFAVYFMDLNGFKVINDTLGHHVGDMVLAEIGSRLRLKYSHVCELCRWGGDEFVAIMYDNKDGNLEEVAPKYVSRFKELLSQPMTFKGVKKPIKVGCAVGFAYSTEAETMDELVELADKRMYADKETSGEGR